MSTVTDRRALFPMWKHMGLELQSLCNRDCDWCPRRLDQSGIRKNHQGSPVVEKMPTDNVHSILDQVFELGFRGPIHFHSLSEPLLDDRYLSIASHAHRQGFLIEENTNGDVLISNPELRQQLDGIVDVFNVGLYDCKTEAEELGLMTWWRGAFLKSTVTFSRMALGTPRIRQNSLLYCIRDQDQRVLEYPCFSPQYQLLIRYDGEVGLCCEDDMCELSLGNAFRERIEDIWWSDKRIAIALDLRKSGSRRAYPLCRACYVFFGWD
jgi:MoaA/NifB/PqqE/SkfB family radical SAM enzyme